jgi:hypothetical protein
MKKLIALVIVIVLVLIGGYYILNNFYGEPQKMKVNSLEITNVFRDCTRSANGDFRDITIQTTIDVDVKKTDKYSIKLSGDDCVLKVGADEVGGFALNKIPTPEPYVDGIEDSGLYMVTGGELSGDISDVLTVCCQDECDTANLEIC